MKIQNYLRKYGYRPDLSDGIFDKYEQALYKYLGREKYDEFRYTRASLEQAGKSEELLEYIGEDEKLTRLVLSGQIQASIDILNFILPVLKEKKVNPSNILELGGADGWALDFLAKKYGWEGTLTVLDGHPLWKSKNPKISIVNSRYSDFDGERKYDLIFSLLGTMQPVEDGFFQCISRSLHEQGLAIIGLWTTSERKFEELIGGLVSEGLKPELESSKTIESLGKKISILTVQKEVVDYSTGELLSIIRSGYSNLPATKSVTGLEAKFLINLIGNTASSNQQKFSWDNGITLMLELIEKDGVLFRKAIFNQSDFFLEYPVRENDPLNNIEEWIKRTNEEGLPVNTP